jgi:hypothetical protein
VVRRKELEQRRDDIDTTLRELDEVEARCREDLKRLGERVSGAVGEERAARTAGGTTRFEGRGGRDG